MDLNFQNKPYSSLQTIMQEARLQEETAEIIVPDSYPDIASIVSCAAEVILRGKDCRDGGVTIAGGIKGSILYAADDGTHPRNLEVYIPFSIKVENSALTPQAQIICTLRVRSADARLINSRKAMIRTHLVCNLAAYDQNAGLFPELTDDPPCLQTKTETYSTVVPLEAAEKSFTINDVLELSLGTQALERVYMFCCHTELSDQKLVGNKAVFKGTLHCNLLYLGEDKFLHRLDQSLPFSQYCEMDTDYDEETVYTQLMVTGYDLDAAEIRDGQLPITVNMLAQCVVSGMKIMTVIEDAYSTKGVLQPRWDDFVLEGSLDQLHTTLTVRQHLSGNITKLLDAAVYWDVPEVSRNADKVTIKIPCTIRAIGYDENDVITALTAKAEAIYDMPLSENAACYVDITPVGEVTSVVNANDLEVKCSVRLHISCAAKEKLRTLSGGTIEDEEMQSQHPSVIVRKVRKEESFWELAKQYRTTVDDILSANQLSEAVLSDDRMLLLPVS